MSGEGARARAAAPGDLVEITAMLVFEAKQVARYECAAIAANAGDGLTAKRIRSFICDEEETETARRARLARQ